MKKTKDSGGTFNLGWELAFTSLSIIMVAFFCMLCSYSDHERGRMIEIIRSFKGSLAVLPGGFKPDLGVELPMAVEGEVVEGAVIPTEAYKEAVEVLKAQLQKAGGKEDFSVEMVQQGLRITLNDTLLFASGSAEIKEPSRDMLDILANTIKKSSVRAIITGHTDDQPINTELYPSNWELSVMRAVNLLRYMKDHFNLPIERLQACGAGEFRPKSANRTPEERAMNRRVEIMLVPLEVTGG
jgi:chemotaxis protein MotB